VFCVPCASSLEKHISVFKLLTFITIYLCIIVIEGMEYYQNCSVLGCVTQCSQSAAHLCEQFLQIQQIGFVTLGPSIEAVA